MAQQVTGHVYIPITAHNTYDHWREYCLTHGIDFDGFYGNQCYDTCALLYFQYGLTFYLGGIGYAYEAWTVARYRNAVPPFRMITNINEVKRGDLLVFGTGWSAFGHVGFADEDYNGSGTITCLGQNQGQGIGWGTPSNIVRLYTYNFLGAFRNSNWQQAPTPTPTPSKKRGGFPWAVYARRLRQKRNNMI